MEQTIRKTLSGFAADMERDAQYEGISDHELLNRWTSRMLTLSNNVRKEAEKLSFEELYKETIYSIQKPEAEKGLFASVPTGFADLDKTMGGLPKGELIVVGARPAMGKTAFLISVMANLIKSQRSTAYFTIENSAQQILLRLLSNYSGITMHRLLSRQMEPDQIRDLGAKTQSLKNAQIVLEDTCFSIDDIICEVEYLVRSEKIEVVLIDYLQLIKVKGRREQSREADVAKVCRELKGLARKYNIAIVVNSQLSRAVETRGGDKRPQLSDLRESGAIEQDADKVVFIHRPEYYNITEDENGASTEGIAEFIIAKNRTGAVDSVKLQFAGNTSSYKDYSSLFSKSHQFGADYFKEIRKNEFKDSPDTIVRGSKMNDIEEEDIPF